MVPHGLLDGHLEVHAVLVEEVDVVNAELAQPLVAGLLDVLGPPVDTPGVGALGIAHDAELGGQHDGVALSLDGLAHEALVVPGAVQGGGVEEGESLVEGSLDRGDRLFLVPVAVELGHSHATEADGGHLEAAKHP